MTPDERDAVRALLAALADPDGDALLCCLGSATAPVHPGEPAPLAVATTRTTLLCASCADLARTNGATVRRLSYADAVERVRRLVEAP